MGNTLLYLMNCSVDCRRSYYSWRYWTKLIFTLSTRKSERSVIDRLRYRPRSGLTQVQLLFYLYLSFTGRHCRARGSRRLWKRIRVMITPTRRDNTLTLYILIPRSPRMTGAVIHQYATSPPSNYDAPEEDV